jgi:hypothetical protein
MRSTSAFKNIDDTFVGAEPTRCVKNEIQMRSDGKNAKIAIRKLKAIVAEFGFDLICHDSLFVICED